MNKVLLIEDDAAISRALADNLNHEGYEAITAASGEEGYVLRKTSNPDLIILDLMLPGMSGLELCRKLRNEGVQTPILMLTAKSEESDRVLGLDLGVRALLRRSQASANLPEELRFGDVEVDFRRYVAKRRGSVIEMTRKEFATLRFLAARAGEAVTRDELLNEVWGYDALPISRTVDNHIAGLRAKLEDDPARPVHILTVHRVGYKFSQNAL
jgi:DNA-binding response OmpR family regulator